MFSSPFIKLWLLVAALIASLGFQVDAHAQSSQLPNTRALENDLTSTRATIQSTRKRQERLKSSIRDLRKELENSKKLIAGLKKVEDKIGRIQREVNSLSKVPQLKWLKPIGKGLSSLKSNVKKVRTKGEEFKRSYVDPALKQAKNLEAKVAKTVAKLKGLETKAGQAKANVVSLRQFVESNIRQTQLVNALERLASETRRSISPVTSGLREIDSAGSGVESKIKSATNALKQLTKLKTGLDKMNKKLTPIDNHARKIAKVLNKKLEFKVPLTKKKVSLSVRKILEAPDKIFKAAAKPLTKLAKKAMAPFSKKKGFDVKAPKELNQMSQKFDQLKNNRLSLDSAGKRIESATNAQQFVQYEQAADRIIRTRTSNLR